MTTENVPMQDPQEQSLVTDEVVKPKRARRTKASELVESAQPAPIDAVQAELATKPKRAPRKKLADVLPDEVVVPASEPVQATIDSAAPVKPKRAPRKKVAEPVSDVAPAPAAVVAAPVSVPQDGEQVERAPMAAASEGEGAPRGERGRRDRGDRRGPRADRPPREERRPQAADGERDEAVPEAMEEGGAQMGSRRAVIAAEQATEVFAELQAEGWDRATLYRNLVDMTDAGLLRRVDLGDHVWRYELEHRVDQLEALRFLVRGDVLTLRGAAVRFVLSSHVVSAAVLGPRTVTQLEELVRETGGGPRYLRDDDLARLYGELEKVGVST